MMHHTLTEDSCGSHAARTQQIDDRLYGKLLETNAALKDAGGMLVFIYALVLLAAYLALRFDWYKEVWFLKDAELNVVWVYLIVFVVVFFVWIAHFRLAQRWCYRRNRPELLDHIDRSGMDRYRLLALIADDKSVAAVAEALKRDRWDGGRNQYLRSSTHRKGF